MKDRKEITLFKCRDWLNRDHGIAMVASHVTIETRSKYDSLEVDGSLTIGDCSRQITLDFDLYIHNNDSKVQKRKKIQVLREKMIRMRKYVGGFMDAMDKAIVEAEAIVKVETAAKKVKA